MPTPDQAQPHVTNIPVPRRAQAGNVAPVMANACGGSINERYRELALNAHGTTSPAPLDVIFKPFQPSKLPSRLDDIVQFSRFGCERRA
jgi:hypothetical protein